MAIAAGAAKVLKMPQEIAFFHDTIGMSVNAVVALGAAQLLAGLLLLFAKTRLPGALIMDLTLLLSAVVLFMAGKLVMAVVTLAVAMIAGLLVVDEIRQKSR
ncbi:MAG: hypothetical protein AAF465_01705 [Pseudomonadota bacterium]